MLMLALRRRVVWLVLLSVALAIGCRRVEPLPPEALQDLDSLAQFAQAFNDDADEHRLLVLLSPT